MRLAFNQHYDCVGATIYKHACALSCEGIVSKRLAHHTAAAEPTVG